MIVNLTKRQCLSPELFGDGRTLLDLAHGSSLMLTALSWLLAEDNGRGDGDAPDDPLIGSWARDSIAVVGDYGSPHESGESLHEQASEGFKDVSSSALRMIAKDETTRLRIVDLGRGELLRHARGK
jgi:hypothetical protein